MTMHTHSRARSRLLVFTLGLTSLPLARYGGEPPPVVAFSTKGDELGSLPAPEKSKVEIMKPAH
ncbi:hypothetical protein [Paludisphaera borealis]|uniref:Uncharacterized protein n=1 Tax=Paludisphaera borealis TaxID=1387353 RepID=A0A1U7CYE6_9BACT|nr:hypothetical protein [Paludisphaera borealis]APW63941.1 hypothetical protein BSF38_05529 [Paludisphaera borealis]